MLLRSAQASNAMCTIRRGLPHWDTRGSFIVLTRKKPFPSKAYRNKPGASRSPDAAAGPRPGNGERARAVVQRRARARRLALRGTRRSADALGNDDGPAALAGRTHPRNGRPRQGKDRPSSAGRDMDELGYRAARRRLGGARRAGDLAGDRRLSDLGCLPSLRHAHQNQEMM